MANRKVVNVLKSKIKFREEESLLGWSWEDAPGTPEKPLDMRGTDLSDAVLEGAILLNTDFTDADLSGIHLDRANCVLAELTRSKLINSSLYSATFDGAVLKDSDLSMAKLGEASFMRANLVRATLDGAMGCSVNFGEASMQGCRFRNAHMEEVGFKYADLSDADLSGSVLRQSNFEGATLTNANFEGATLPHSNLRGADCRGANFKNACIQFSNLVEADFTDACLDGAHVYGVSCWGTRLDNTSQNSLLVTSHEEPAVTADQLDVAQLIYLLLNHEGVRGVIEQISSKGVLILGRFGPRKGNLDAIRDALRQQGYLPLLCDFDAPSDRDLTETVRILASLSRFIIADLTEPRSIPHELQAIVPDMAIPVRTIIEGDEVEYVMSKDLNKYPWFIKDPMRYENQQDLIARLKGEVIAVAEERADSIRN